MACDYYCLPSLLDLSFHRYDIRFVSEIKNHLAASVVPAIFLQLQSCILSHLTSKTDSVAAWQSVEHLADPSWQRLSTGG